MHFILPSYLSASFLTLSLLISPFLLEAKPLIPPLSGPVVDLAQLIPEEAKAQLSRELMNLKNESGVQIQILTIESLQGYPIETYTIEVVEEWKLGEEASDKGLLIFLSRDDRKLRIEVGQGLEGVITDARAGRIIREQMAPHFRNGRYDLGLFSAVATIKDVILSPSRSKDDWRPRRKLKMREGLAIFLFVIACAVIGFLPLLFSGGRRRGIRPYGNHYGGWGSGGGSWSGGGGGFSGGGASGNW